MNSKRVKFVRLPTLAALVLIALFLPRRAPGQMCEGDWQYTETSLQKARGRLKSKAIHTWASKVDCAKEILGTPGLAGSFSACENCAREYAGLLADAAVTMRAAAGASSGARETGYLKKELSVRRRLHEFLLEDDQQDMRGAYFGINLQALADTMFRVKQAQDYHQLMTQLSEGSDPRSPKLAGLNSEIFRLWINAVRSCPAWDFKSVDDRAKLREALCGADCSDHLTAVYGGLQAAGLLLAQLPRFGR